MIADSATLDETDWINVFLRAVVIVFVAVVVVDAAAGKPDDSVVLPRELMLLVLFAAPFAALAVFAAPFAKKSIPVVIPIVSRAVAPAIA